MLENFERFTDKGRSFTPKVSIRKRGQFGFNLAAIDKFNLEKFEYVVLFISKDRKQIAIKFTNEQEKGVNKLAKRKGNYYFGGKSFLEKYEIDYSETKSFEPEKVPDEDAIIISLE